jgi:hypothetical protein
MTMHRIEVGPPDRRRWRFWCAHCDGYHWHLAKPGHSAAHCWTPAGRRAFPRGYILELASTSKKSAMR